MKCSLGISNFLEEICSLSHSIVFLYLFAFITEEVFRISPCYSLELCIQMETISLSPLPFASLLSSAICTASSDNHFAFCISFSWGWSWSLPLVQCSFIYSSINRYLGCFHILALVNNSAMDISSFPLCICPEVELLDYVVALFLIFWGKAMHILIMSVPLYSPLNSAQGYALLHIFLSIAVFCLWVYAVLSSSVLSNSLRPHGL